jgi:CO dehydrogenase nickel-insertion accessory protein CooC1
MLRSPWLKFRRTIGYSKRRGTRELGREIGIPRIVAVANKRDEEERLAIREFAEKHDLLLIANSDGRPASDG